MKTLDLDTLTLCNAHVDRFRERFPEGLPVSEESFKKVCQEGLDFPQLIITYLEDLGRDDSLNLANKYREEWDQCTIRTIPLVAPNDFLSPWARWCDLFDAASVRGNNVVQLGFADRWAFRSEVLLKAWETAPVDLKERTLGILSDYERVK